MEPSLATVKQTDRTYAASFTFCLRFFCIPLRLIRAALGFIHASRAEGRLGIRKKHAHDLLP